MKQKLNTKLRDLLKSKKAKTHKLAKLSKTEQNRLVKLKEVLNRLRRGKNVLSESRKINTILISKRQMQYACNNELKQLLTACWRRRLIVFNGTDY